MEREGEKIAKYIYMCNSVADPGLLDPDPDPSVRGMDLLSPSKNSNKNLDSYCFVTSF